MRKYLLSLLLFVVFFGFVSCKEEAKQIDSQLSKEKHIVIGTNATYPPNEYLDKDGKIVGLEIDLVKLVLKKAGYNNYEVVDMDFDGLISALTNKKIDIIASSMASSEARKLKISFSDSYFDDPDSGVSIFVKENSAINGVEDLRNKIIGSEIGTFAWSILEKWKEEGKIGDLIGFSGVQLMDALFIDKIDALFVAVDGPKYFIKNNTDTSKKIKMVGEMFPTPGVGFGIRKEDENFLNDVNKAFNELKQSGEYQKLYDRLQDEMKKMESE